VNRLALFFECKSYGGLLMIVKSSALLVGVLLLAGFAHLEAAKTDAAVAKPATAGVFTQVFSKHWTTAKELTIAVADAMPAEDYGFKPVPDEMSFGEQMLHIADANYSYCALLSDAKSPFVELPKDAKVEKAEALKQLTGSFDYCSSAFSEMTDAQLDATHGSSERKPTTRDLMLGLMIHMAHHRGQAEVYLRLKGITPPKYKS
jgi:uncharacterized damage-inducible protein DinB